MAGILDPFTPGATADPTAGIGDPSAYANLVGQWNQFLSDPRGRGALLSAGLALMQPRSFGDTPASQIGRAIGAGGESIRSADTQDLKEREVASKEELRGAQATAAEARAGAATANANTAATRAAAATDRLALMRELEQGRTDRLNLAQRVRLSDLYQRHINQIATQNARNQRQNADPLNRGAPGFQPLPILPVPTMQQWLQTHPAEVQGLFPSEAAPTGPAATGVSSAVGGGAPAIPGSGGGPTRTPPAAAITYLQQNPDTADLFDERYGPGSAARILGTPQ